MMERGRAAPLRLSCGLRAKPRADSYFSISQIWGAGIPVGGEFPPYFKFGVASAAYQVEGAWNVSDKGESIWDRFLHTQPDIVVDSSNGDIACDSYHNWRRDIEMVEELGVQTYRFSIAWTRLLPTGFSNYISEDGKNYYNNLIDGLLEKGIEPFVTIYHWDLPQSLQDLGGWTNPIIVDLFADYATVVYDLFADRVKLWITINEPLMVCDASYSKFTAPYLNDTKIGIYLCNKNILLAHAKAYRIYDEQYRYKYHGKLTLANLFFWFEPETPDDEEVTKLMLQLWEGRYSHPIFSAEGGWPPELEQYLNANSLKEGYSSPRLPPLTKEEIEMIKGTFDFYALNHYTTRLVRRVKPGQTGTFPFYGSDELGITYVNNPSWGVGEADWFAIHPEGLRSQLHWIQKTYQVNEIMITENGIPTVKKDLYDWTRMNYLRKNLEQILISINEGINVTAYSAWSLMDNFEWLAGYTTNYGLYSVDFKHPNRTRQPRESARYYSSVTRLRSVQPTRVGLNYL